MSRLVLLRRRGLVLPSFEIYGGVSGLVDYGPVGARIKRRVIDAWIEHWGSITNVVEIDSHNYSEPFYRKRTCWRVQRQNVRMRIFGSAFRRSLVAEFHEAPDTLSSNELDDLIEERAYDVRAVTHPTGRRQCR